MSPRPVWYAWRVSHVRPVARPVRKALRKANLSGSFILGKYSFSPYMACEHGCVYCDGRAERYWVDGEFDRDILYRPNLPELVGAELPKLRERGFVSIGSGISDAYQPLEERLRITRQCAEILAAHDHPVSLMTKSALALRDLDFWAEVNRRSRFLFLVSLTHGTDDTRAVWEPGASTVAARIDALREFKSAGCATGILAMPLLPGITDTDQNLTRLFEIAVETRADFIMAGGLTLRPGRQKEFFLEHLGRHRNDLVPHYAELYGENRTSGAPLSSYLRELNARAFKLNQVRRVPSLVPHGVYAGQLHLYDEVNVLLRHMVELYGARGADTGRLVAALHRYMNWLKSRKREYNRHRSWSYEDLSRELLHEAESGHLSGLLGNGKLAAFLEKVMVGGGVLDYTTLRLIQSGSGTGAAGSAIGA